MENSVPMFDFVILGKGDDGHTSSIFPNEMELIHVEEPYVVSENPYDSSLRICLTGRPLVKAHHSYFLVVGETKKNIVEEVLKSDSDKVYPAGYVWHHAREPHLFYAPQEGVAALLG